MKNKKKIVFDNFRTSMGETSQRIIRAVDSIYGICAQANMAADT